MKFKILHTEASLGWGGQEIRTFREAVGMRERGHSVTIAAHPKSRLLQTAAKNGFRTVPVVFKRRRMLKLIIFFRTLIEQEEIDVVNTHSSKDSWIVLPSARLSARKPLVLRTRHLSTPIGKTPLNRLLYEVLPHYVITTGEAIRQQMISINHFTADNIISLPTGVDLNVFDPEIEYNNVRSELNLPASTPLVGTVSVIRSWKGIDYLIKAAPLILNKTPGARFIVAGDGPHTNTLLRTIEETGVKDAVYLLGHRDDVKDILRSLDILVHPSYGHEGVPQTILQAMAMKRPVIASDIPPLREVVKDNTTGLLVPVKDSEGIARAVISLLHDKEAAAYLAANARNMVEKCYSFSGMLDKIEQIYGEKIVIG